MTEPGSDKKAVKAAKKAAQEEQWKNTSAGVKVVTYIVGAALIGGVIWLVQSGKSSDEATSPTGRPPAAAAALPNSVPQLTAGQQTNLLAGLRAIDPDIASYEQGAINSARNICGDLRDGVNPPRVSQRYDKVPLTSAQETQIVGLIRTTFCPW